MRFSVTLPALICLGVMSFLSCGLLVGEELARESPLEDLARGIEHSPNDASRHLELARAYYARGATGDSLRVMRHLKRALELNPGLENQARSLLNDPDVGRSEEATDSEAEALDRRIAASLPADSGEDDPEENAIRVGLADRLSQRDFRRVSGYEAERNDLEKLFDWRGEELPSWAERFSDLADGFHAGGWGAVLDGAGPNLIKATRAGRLEGHAFLVPMSEVTTESVNLFEAKAQAAVAFADGAFSEAMDRLLDTVAASETLLDGRLQLSRSFEDTVVVTVPTTPFTIGNDGGQGRPQIVQGKLTEAESVDLVQAISQKGLESLEAVANPAVSREKAMEKVVELACMGNCGSPLLVDLDEDGCPGLRGSLMPDGIFTSEGAVSFDLDGVGGAERVEWLRGGRDGLLCVDLNGNGLVDSGRELFGTALGDRDGWARLARWDLDGDGWVSGRERVGLMLWVDDGDGRCEGKELRTVAAMGIDALSCRPEANRAWVRMGGRRLAMWDWWPELRY